MLPIVMNIAFAQDPAAPEAAATEAEAAAAAMAEFEAGLSVVHGDVELGSGKAVLHVPESFGYLDAAETDRVLQAWGNPPDPATWGMLLPAGASVFDDSTWAIVITYSDDGHVADDDAAELDYAEILEQMQEGSRAESEARVKAGLSPLSLVGWAEPPHYDGTSHKIYWAKELAFGEGGHTLNYAIRALGREGVLEFNAVASLDQLATIKGPMEQVMAFAEFKAGSRYEDFDGSTDRTAEYGLAALVAGGVAAKTGLFKGLLAALIAGKKLVIGGLLALVAAGKAMFGKKDEPQQG